MRNVTIFAVWLCTLANAHAEARDISRDTVEGVIVPGEHTRLQTPHGVVHVWAPEGYRAETASLVVYVHGYFVDADDAWWAHGLPEQFGAASLNALYVVPESPAGPRDFVRWLSLAELVAAIDGKIPQQLPALPAIVLGHSGAYRTLEQWLTDPTVNTIVLLDAGYGAREPWLQWARSPSHRLVTVSSDTMWWCDQLHGQLPARVVDGIPARPETFARSRIVHVRTALDHWQVVTTALPATLRMLAIAKLAH